jgi:DNA anti-recombination protein RmuC
MVTTNALEKRIDGLERRMTKGFADLSAVITSSIDGLAILCKNNFDRIEERFKQVDERFEQVDVRFEQIDERFDQMDRRFDRIENISIGSHERRIEKLEDNVLEIKTKIGLKRK